MLVNPKENLWQIVRVTNAYASRGGERIQSTHTNRKLHGRLVPGQSTNVPLNEAFFSKKSVGIPPLFTMWRRKEEYAHGWTAALDSFLTCPFAAFLRMSRVAQLFERTTT